MEDRNDNCFVCPKFWKDVENLKKKISSQYFDTTYSIENFQKLSTASQIESIPLIDVISTTINNKIASLEEIPAIKYNRQPFLEEGWVVYKLRWAVDNKQ